MTPNEIQIRLDRNKAVIANGDLFKSLSQVERRKRLIALYNDSKALGKIEMTPKELWKACIIKAPNKSAIRQLPRDERLELTAAMREVAHILEIIYNTGKYRKAAMIVTFYVLSLALDPLDHYEDI